MGITDKSLTYGLTSSPVLKECPGQSLCSECFWSNHNGGYCTGCDSSYYQRCVKQRCAFVCSVCSGGKHALTPGCCGRMSVSLLEKLEKLLNYSVPVHKTTALPIRCRLIPVIFPQISKYRIPEHFPQVETWAVPIHKVASIRKGFRSDDLKKYLGLPSDRKLILSTSAPDDYQEMLWKKGPQMCYEEHGIDYWFPAHFSIYDDDSKLYQFANAKRQLLHAIWTRSQFFWFRLGKHIPVEFLEPIHNAASVLISTHQMYSKKNRENLKKEVQTADEWFPPETAFFFVGGRRNLPISSKRTCFVINSNWLMCALKGRNLAGKWENGLKVKELLVKNLKEVLESVHPTLL